MSKTSKPAAPAPQAAPTPPPATTPEPSPAAASDAPQFATVADLDALRAEIATLRARVPVLEEIAAVDFDTITIDSTATDAAKLSALCAAVNLGAPDNVRRAALVLANRLASGVSDE